LNSASSDSRRRNGQSCARSPTATRPIAADLCRKLNYDTGSMTRMLNRLEEKGVIVREPAEDDRRIVRLHMTAAGRRIYPKLRDATLRVLNNLVAGFSEADVQQVHEQLRRMYSNMDYVNDNADA
jgi:DNA-binding MarR family transcriptional regulator